MSDTLATALLLPVMLFFFLLVPDFIMYANISVKANHIATDTVQLAERVGGFEYSEGGTSVNLGEHIEEQFRFNNLNVDAWSYEYTAGRVDYNKPMQVVIRGGYYFSIFRILGMSDDELEFSTTIPVVATRSGVGQVFFR
ncbi:DUF4320 family protein [Viridibacillus arvi]|uniref:DUF4320 family protein n=1 Tax=Viridibacillus arvi TaxID=263475 RepID=UPI0034CD88B6